ncbi:MAG TPA: carbon starvation protein A [Methylomusa anaerophila]|uniref:Carbon starvation protein A n=1 Tax=Methylomusa anaerophila TaxID=1930071 RepID=A0A348APH4_9FIRM|nr:carbon starvation protein A [Methylomusa anaerophila]BBB92972.1 carbon starvation protein A [Methylomusa anaerophila]HML87194.1 carbon starvation protein A [Methylomusa anaerophila]
MNSISLLVIAICVFVLAYRYYSSFIATKVLMLNDANVTPAHHCNDGREYVPTNKWVLFGHHFAAIAGAGPLVGPVLAAQYGWGPGFVWILLGSVFAGAVHDFIILFASTRHNGQSLAVIARREVGPVTGIASSLSILFIIIVALAGLAIVVVNALFKNSWGVYTLSMTIPIAIAVGLYMFKIVPGAVRSGSIAGFLLVIAAVITGHWLNPGQPWAGIAGIFDLTKQQLSIALPLYGFFAAILPVWLLLAPRDYLSSYMKIGTVLALALGILIVQPAVNMPVTTRFLDGGGPVIPGPWWPYVFITIACGAISGFHALISSGTTPKMMELESHARPIAFGGMLTEGFIAVMALISAIVLMPGDYFAINTSQAIFAKLNMPTVELTELSRLVNIDVSHRPGGAVSLAVGMAHIFSSIGGMKYLMNYWYQFAIMFEALFILTTIDAGTRVARYILQDIAGEYLYAPLKQANWWPGILITSAIVTCSWGYLLYSGDVATIWPLFGVANQLLAVVALAIGTTIVLKIAAKKAYVWITLAPLSFLSVTVLAAGIMNAQMFLKRGDALGIANGTISIILIVLVIVTLLDSIRVWLSLLKSDKPVGLNTEVGVSCEYGNTKPNLPG